MQSKLVNISICHVQLATVQVIMSFINDVVLTRGRDSHHYCVSLAVFLLSHLPVSISGGISRKSEMIQNKGILKRTMIDLLALLAHFKLYLLVQTVIPDQQGTKKYTQSYKDLKHILRLLFLSYSYCISLHINVGRQSWFLPCLEGNQ